jgi:hypothetical protein
MADSYTPRLIAALRSRSFGDAADLIESQQAEIARLRKIEAAARALMSDRGSGMAVDLLVDLLKEDAQ